MKKLIKNNLYTITGITLLNILSAFLFVRIDFTFNNRYSLSKVSKEAIQDIKEPVSIDFYITEDLPQDIKKVAKEFISLIKEYKSRSKVAFSLNIIHPNTEQKGNMALASGIQPILMELRERDMEKIQNVFMGAVIKIGNKQSVIPYIDHNTPIEYEITRILKQTTDTVKPHIAFVSGHREAMLGQMPQLINELSHLTDISVIKLFNAGDLNRFNVLCIVGPQDMYTPYEKEQLEKYLANGGRLFIALNHAVGQLNESQHNGYINPTGLEDILAEKGLKIQPDFVVDNNCGTMTVNQHNGFMNYQSNVSFPYLPMITNFSKHTITHGLNAIFLPFASSIEQIKTNTTYIFTPLATTSSLSGTKHAPIFFNLQHQWNRNDFNKPKSVVAALLTNDDNNSAIVAITDADFLINDIGLYAHVLRQDNINFAINSIEWLADNSGLIRLRNKFATFASLQPIDEHYKNFLKYFNFLLPLAAIIIFAAVRFQRNRKRRLNRSRPGYIE